MDADNHGEEGITFPGVDAHIMKMHGEYVCIVDQDDRISVDYISYFYSMICEYQAEIACTPSADKFMETITEKNKE